MAEITARNPEFHSELNLMAQSKAFFGREFLTWLWFQAEAKEGTMKLPSGVTLKLWVDDRLVLESSQTRAHVNTLRGGAPSQSIEAATALKGGKSVRELKVGMHIDGTGDYTAVLTSHDLSPRSLKLPPPQQSNQGSDVAQRLHLTRLFLDALDGLFSVFMKERVSGRWEKEGLANIRSWISKRAERDLGLLH